MSWGVARRALVLVYLFACESRSGDNVAIPTSNGGTSDGLTPSSTVPSEQPSSTSSVSCDDVGPPCGFSVAFAPNRLGLGQYSIELRTPAGTTSCSLDIEPEHLQTEAEAYAQDAMLVDCAAHDTCPPPACVGPDIVYAGADGVTIIDEPIAVTIVVRNLATGQVTQQSFMPTYSDHPEHTESCHMCRVAQGVMSFSS
jgi:hypothetical protein